MAQSHGVLVDRKSCLPCMHGEHGMCRGHPNNDGSLWETDEKTGGRSLVLRERGFLGSERGGAVRPRPPCQCQVGDHEGSPGTCYAFHTHAHGSFRCGRPAKGKIEIKRFAQNWTEIEACGIHIRARNTVLANDKIREEKWAAEKVEAAAVKAAGQASVDWAAKLASEFGLPVKALKNET